VENPKAAGKKFRAGWEEYKRNRRRLKKNCLEVQNRIRTYWENSRSYYNHINVLLRARISDCERRKKAFTHSISKKYLARTQKFYADAAVEYYNDVKKVLSCSFTGWHDVIIRLNKNRQEVDAAFAAAKNKENLDDSIIENRIQLTVDYTMQAKQDVLVNNLDAGLDMFELRGVDNMQCHENPIDLMYLFQRAADVFTPFVDKCIELKEIFQSIDPSVKILDDKGKDLDRRGLRQFPGTRKTRQRIIAKVFERSNNGKASVNIRDTLRASFGFDRLSVLLSGVELLTEHAEVTRIKNRMCGKYEDPFTRDVLVNIKVKGLLCEIQLTLNGVQKFRDHDAYALMRTLGIPLDGNVLNEVPTVN